MPSPEPYDPKGIKHYTIPTFTFASGTTLHEVIVAYKSINPAARTTNGTVLIPTCYGGLINTTLNFTVSPHDCMSSYHVVVVAMLGNGESASPSNKKLFPEPGELRYQDCIRSQYALLTDHLKVESLEAVIGFSMGAQQCFHWATMYPNFVKRIVPICGSARTSPHNYAFLEGPIGALTNSIDYVAWKEMKAKIARGEDVGVNLSQVKPKRGLKAFGRAYNAWLTSAAWFRQGWWGKGKEEGGMGCESVEGWIEQSSDGFLEGDAEDLLVLARMWQCGDITNVMPDKEKMIEVGCKKEERKDEGFEQALGSIEAKCLVMPCRTDQYFPPEDSEFEVKHLRHGRLCVIESVWGHVAGGGMNVRDVEFMNEKIGEFMQETLDMRALMQTLSGDKLDEK